VRRYEFDRYREATDRRLDRMEKRADDHAEEHDDDEEAATKEAREKSRWSWQQVIAVITVAGMLTGLWMQALAR
jgi:hypothetical protein